MPIHVPQPYTVIRKIPYEVKVPVDKPYEVKINVPQPYTVEKKVSSDTISSKKNIVHSDISSLFFLNLISLIRNAKNTYFCNENSKKKKRLILENHTMASVIW